MTAGALFSRRKRVHVIVLVALAAVVAGEWLLVNPGRGVSGASGISASIGSAERLDPVGANPSANAYSAVINRDLFAQNRQAPPDVLGRTAVQKSTVAGELRVIGIVTAGNDRTAVIAGTQDGAPAKVHVGDRIGSAKVIAITPDRVTLERNGTKMTLGVLHEVAERNAAAETGSTNAPFNAAAAKEMIRNYYKGRQFGVMANPDADRPNGSR